MDEDMGQFSVLEYLVVTAMAVLVALLFLPGIMMPHRGASREKARRVNCAGNLKQIGLACIIYAEDDGATGRFPPDLATLNRQQFLCDGKVYACPSAARHGTTAAGSNYLYFGAGVHAGTPDPANTPVACCMGHDGRWVNVLYADGHVKGCKPAEWKRICAKRGGDYQALKNEAAKRR